MQALELKHIIEQFTPITLGEMDEVKLMNRVDTKFAFSFFAFKISNHNNDNVLQ